MDFFTIGHERASCDDGQPEQVILGDSCYDTLETGRKKREVENTEEQE